MAGKGELDHVHQNAIHVETVRKEERLQKVHTEFGINPYRKLHVVTDKPNARKPEVFEDNAEFIQAFHKARDVPTKKYSAPVTESQEIGWISAPLIPSNRHDRRLNFFRFSTDVTIHKETALRHHNKI